MGQTIASSFVWNREADDTNDADDADAVADAKMISIPFEMSETSSKPERKTAEAAGFDLCASEALTLDSTKWVKVKTGVKLGIGAFDAKQALGSNFVVYGAIRGRSGLTAKGIEVFHGTVDSDFTGELIVLVKNTNLEPFTVNVGDRIAQLIFAVALTPELVKVDKLSFTTERGENGFGSTGVGAADSAC